MRTGEARERRSAVPVGTRGPGSSRAKLLAMAVAGFAVYLLMNHLMVGMIGEHLLERGLHKSLAYLLWMACGYLVFFGVVVTTRWTSLAAFLVVFALSVASNYTYAAIFTGARPGAPPQHLTPEVMEWMVHEVGQAPLAWGEYRQEAISGLARAVAMLGLFLVARSLVRRSSLYAGSFLARPRAGQATVALFAAFQSLAMLLQPSYSMAETNTLVFGIPGLLATSPDAQPTPVRPAGPGPAEKIVLVVDESVTYQAYRAVVAASLDGLPAADAGEAASIANCSASSNALLRWGVERSSLGGAGRDPRGNPTIWGFARTAGYRTVLIDGQSKGALQNFLGTSELRLIDEFVAAEAGLDTDRHIASLLNAHLRSVGREFVYVVKRGAHFPYEADYRPGAVPPDAPPRLRHAAAVAHSTGGFFPALFEGVDLSKVLLIYTSDHGQDFTGRSTHCSAYPRAEEFSVPLVVVTGVPGLRTRLAAADEGMRHRASHLNVFPSLLVGMGYQQDWIESHYGATLAGPPTPRLRLASHLPFPTRRRPVVAFSEVPGPPASARAGGEEPQQRAGSSAGPGSLGWTGARP